MDVYSLNLISPFVPFHWSAHVFPPVSDFPIDANSGEDQNNRPKSVRSWWHWAVSRGPGQDRLLQSTGEITAAAITSDSYTDRNHLLYLCVSLFFLLTHTHALTTFLVFFFLWPGLWFIAHLHGQDSPVPVPHARQEGCPHWLRFANPRCSC